MFQHPPTKKLTNDILEEAANYSLKNRVEPIGLKGYQTYLKTGDRLPFEHQYFARRKQLNVLALDVLIRNNDESIPLLEEVMFQICNEYSWALPAHIPLMDHSFSKESKTIIDLFAAETAQALAEIVELIGAQLSDFIKQRIYEEIDIRIFIPFEEKDWHWERLRNNWSSVIAGSIGLAALSILPLHSERQKQILNRLQISFDHYLEGFKEDGVCVEGVDYWAYGFGYYCYFAEKYTRLYHDDRYIRDQKIKSIAEFPFYSMIGENRYVPYSDTSNHSELPSGLLCYCQKTFDVAIPPVAEATSLDSDHCYRWAPMYRNLMWTTDASVTEAVKASRHYFPDFEWLVIRDLESRFIFSAKGGANNESHNHNDIGHFIIGDGLDLLLTDLGAGEYTRDYFGNKRYTFLPNRALGHSLPLIQGKEQKEGEFQAQNVHFKVMDELTSEFSLELAKTYPEVKGLKSFHRKWIVNEQEKCVLLDDVLQFNSAEQASVTENFVSLFEPMIVENRIVWRGNESELILDFDQNSDTPIIREDAFFNHDGVETKVYLTQLENKKKRCQYILRYAFKLHEL
ncbi:heparinase II/III family protein [Lederbergia sp. NSJ-179]|uniref:heparinase II/III family protein n=1 Tax=Lederbergia sp. NSJ-179 TaxID=2931402 RepID=UPI001FD4B4E7|nr:heparinase II/III family protein [Lederbergia sp. NSJ-179]MCJ7842264.1 heparinase II/III family protein [Lederbergia sp. NSJ-179]